MLEEVSRSYKVDGESGYVHSQSQHIIVRFKIEYYHSLTFTKIKAMILLVIGKWFGRGKGATILRDHFMLDEFIGALRVAAIAMWHSPHMLVISACSTL